MEFNIKFSGCSLEKIDYSIGELVHLRYLNLSNNYIEVLPESIGKLYHLQTLKLNYGLTKWPKDMHNLINLRHLTVTRSMPYEDDIPIPNVGRLTSLRSLSYFTAGQEKRYQIAELGPLKHLSGDLHLNDLEKVSSKEDAAKADLSGKNLDRISFIWSDCKDAKRNDKDVLEGLQAPRSVKSLTVVKFSGDTFPKWVMKMAIDIGGKWMPLHKLVRIKLMQCDCLYLPVLENLPLLQGLELLDMGKLTCLSNSLGESVNVTRSTKHLSPTLRSLRLYGMKKLEKWIDTETTNSSTMLSPVLESLSIERCSKITHLDESHPHPLVSLVISECENLVSIKSIQGLTSLESLKIAYCPGLLEIGYLQNYEHPPLKSLTMYGNKKLTSLPRFDCFSFLNTLAIGTFSKELRSFPSLQGIEKLRNHLRIVQLSGWDHWESIPEEIKYLTSLTQLTIEGLGIQELPMWLTNMSSIREMKFYFCKKLDEEKVKRAAPPGVDLFIYKCKP